VFEGVIYVREGDLVALLEFFLKFYLHFSIRKALV
jgi:hypothetical protein